MTEAAAENAFTHGTRAPRHDTDSGEKPTSGVHAFGSGGGRQSMEKSAIGSQTILYFWQQNPCIAGSKGNDGGDDIAVHHGQTGMDREE